MYDKAPATGEPPPFAHAETKGDPDHALDHAAATPDLIEIEA